MPRTTFSLAVPSDDAVKRITRFSGWWLDDAKVHPGTLHLAVDGVPVAGLQRVMWHDLARALPDERRAAAADMWAIWSFPKPVSPDRTLSSRLKDR